MPSGDAGPPPESAPGVRGEGLLALAAGGDHLPGMKPARALLGAGGGLLDRALCVAGAVAFSQFPEFIQQYLQRLGGHLDEARRHLAEFQQTAAQSGLSLDALIHQTSTNADPAVARLGGVMAETAARVDHLAAAQAALQDATVWTRPFVFLRHLDSSIAGGTWTAFRPAVPTTVEGLIYALAGMVVLLGLYHLGLRMPVSRALARRELRAGGRA